MRSSASGADRRFYEVAESYIFRYLELDPIAATYMGVHKYDSQMPRGDKRGVMEVRNLMLEFSSALEEVEEGRLSPEARIDYRLCRDAISLHLFAIDELQLWRKFPFASTKIGDAIFPLFAREFAPFPDRFASIVSRLEKCPRFLRESMECLEDPIEVYIDVAVEASRRLPHLLDAVYEAGRKELGEESDLVERARHAIETLNTQLVDYIGWLEDRRAGARRDFAIGRERYAKLLRMKGIDMGPEEVLRLGERYFSQIKRRLVELASRIAPGGTVEDARKIVESEAPASFDEVLEEYRKAVERARRFVVERRIAPIPERERIVIVETPHYLRTMIPFAAYFPPAPFDEERVGLYMVTPPERPEQMRRHNRYSISNTAVHEAYPGHHLQLSWAAAVRNLVRLFYKSDVFIEGWAHYCEDLMKEYGFDDTDRHRFVQLLDALWRAARVILDVKLATGEMSFEEAVEFLVREVGMDREAAAAEVKRYTLTPGYQLAYLVGKHMLVKLREEVRRVLGEKYNDYRFHEVVLKSGGLPYKYLRELVMEKLREES
ncbi:hypothetical protein B6U99_02680 [Candidatus Geothermarchaeota archaeon ex4572_27]|nr:MAG: hypothetical protein B6U99_02680 [Candidatus Geothermarchaeota archaeon ex4572_27]